MSSYTQTDLANIKKAIASGLQQAMIQGEMVSYRSLAEMRKIQTMIENDLAGSSRKVMPVRYPVTDRGL